MKRTSQSRLFLRELVNGSRVWRAPPADCWCSHCTARGWPVEIPQHARWPSGGEATDLQMQLSRGLRPLVSANQIASELEAAEGKQMNGWKFQEREMPGLNMLSAQCVRVCMF